MENNQTIMSYIEQYNSGKVSNSTKTDILYICIAMSMVDTLKQYVPLSKETEASFIQYLVAQLKLGNTLTVSRNRKREVVSLQMNGEDLVQIATLYYKREDEMESSIIKPLSIDKEATCKVEGIVCANRIYRGQNEYIFNRNVQVNANHVALTQNYDYFFVERISLDEEAPLQKQITKVSPCFSNGGYLQNYDFGTYSVHESTYTCDPYLSYGEITSRPMENKECKLLTGKSIPVKQRILMKRR